MQNLNFKNVFFQARKPSRFFVMIGKIYNRIYKYEGSLSKEQNLEWIKNNVSEISSFANSISPKIWKESKMQSNILEKNANDILKDLKVNIGGGAAYSLLYFLTRYLKPENVIETGVAAGFSSNSILTALHKNGKGKLYSSDFPYFRIKNPEKYIGIVVEKKLKKNWELFIEGDSNNLRRICKKLKKIDIFSYDSDKTYHGVKSAFEKISNLLTQDTVIILDDIQDHSFFYDYLKQKNILNWRVFQFEGKYLGLISNL